jgi:hypothetical protein
MTEEGEMVVAKVSREREVFFVLQSMTGQEVGEAQVIVGKTGHDILLRAEHFNAGAVAGETEADETVMDQSGQIRENDIDDLPGREVIGLVDARQGFLRAGGRLFLFIKFKNEKGFLRQEAGEVLKETGEFPGSQHRRQAIGVRRIFQSFEKITFFQQGTAQALRIRPGTQAERKVEGTV